MNTESLHGPSPEPLEEMFSSLTEILEGVFPKQDISSDEESFLTTYVSPFKEKYDPKNVVGVGFGNITFTNLWERREKIVEVPLVNWQKHYDIKETKPSFDIETFFPRKTYLENISRFSQSLDEAVRKEDERLQRVKNMFHQDIRKKVFNHVYRIKDDSSEIYVFATSDENLPEAIENKIQKQRISAYQSRTQKELF